MNELNDKNFVIECSDDDNYDNNEDNYRLVNGKKIWEPNGQQISLLYRQLEAKGFIELRWQCPGRRSPSVHNFNTNDRQKIDSGDNETNTSDKNDLMTEFDFETESQIPVTKTGPLQRRRMTGLKLQTNLTKVMADIKKYQLIDQKGKKMPIQTPTPPPMQTINVPKIEPELHSELINSESIPIDSNTNSEPMTTL